MNVSERGAEYVLQQLEEVVHDLAGGVGSPKDRLLNVALSYLHKLQEKDFSGNDEVNDLWRRIYQSLTSGGSFSDTVRQMTTAEATQVCRQLVTLKNAYKRYVRQ